MCNFLPLIIHALPAIVIGMLLFTSREIVEFMDCLWIGYYVSVLFENDSVATFFMYIILEVHRVLRQHQ